MALEATVEHRREEALLSELGTAQSALEQFLREQFPQKPAELVRVDISKGETDIDGYHITYQKSANHDSISAEVTCPDGTKIHYQTEFGDNEFSRGASIAAESQHTTLNIRISGRKEQGGTGKTVRASHESGNDSTQQTRERLLTTSKTALEKLQQVIETRRKAVEGNAGIKECREAMQTLEANLQKLLAFLQRYRRGGERKHGEAGDEEQQLMSELAKILHQSKEGLQEGDVTVYQGGLSGKRGYQRITIDAGKHKIQVGFDGGYDSDIFLDNSSDKPTYAHYNRDGSRPEMVAVDGNIVEEVTPQGVYLGNGGQTHAEAIRSWQWQRGRRDNALEDIRIRTVDQLADKIKKGLYALVGKEVATAEDLMGDATRQVGPKPTNNTITHQEYASRIHIMAETVKQGLKILENKYKALEAAKQIQA